MKIFNHNIIATLSLCLCIIACIDKEIERTLEIAGENKSELQKVLDYYKDGDNEKYEAAKFLIGNIVKHHYTTNEQTDTFINIIQNTENAPQKIQLNDWWKHSQKYSGDIKVFYDAQNLTASYLINNIDYAFKVWKKSPWRKRVSFNHFCNYILPYRFEIEPLIPNWRDTLYNRYYSLIKNENDVKRAYAIVYREINKKYKSYILDFPGYMDVLTMEKIYSGVCMKRCVHMGSIMRALGIPVTIDYIDCWANYSKKGHTWLSLILDDGTYTLHGNDTIVKKNNPINSSIFEGIDFDTIDFPYNNYFKKRCAIIHRKEFSRYTESDKKNVSHEYGYDIQIKGPKENCYLCIFKTGTGWYPIAVSTNNSGISTFENIGDSIVYLLSTFKNNDFNFVGYPFIATKDSIYYLIPNIAKRHNVNLCRKYPLIPSIIKRWGQFIGGKFELSNDSSFKHSYTLATINKIPLYYNKIHNSSTKEYRFIRFTATDSTKPQFAEIEIRNGIQLLDGKIIGDSLIDLFRAFDKDKYTHIKNPTNGYCFTIDLGKSYKITDITYFPYNDDNFVLPQEEFELYYWNNKWISLGKKISDSYYVTFNNVPNGSLLLLKNHTKGSEERIFTYEDGKQVWW